MLEVGPPHETYVHESGFLAELRTPEVDRTLEQGIREHNGLGEYGVSQVEVTSTPQVLVIEELRTEELSILVNAALANVRRDCVEDRGVERTVSFS